MFVFLRLRAVNFSRFTLQFFGKIIMLVMV